MVKNTNPNPTQKRPSLPWKTRITLFFLNLFTTASRRSDGTVNRLIFRLLDYVGLKTPPNPRFSRRVRTTDITLDPSRNLWFRLFVPNDPPPPHASQSPLPVIIFFHGGGFVYLSPDFTAYDYVCRRFARAVSAVVVSVNYRLAPEHRYPAQHDDGFDVLRFLDDDQDHLLPENADLSRCFLAGDSAGGNIAHHVAARACNSNFNRLKVIGVVAIQPFFGGEERTVSEIELRDVDVIVSTKKSDWMWNAFMGPGSGMDRDHEIINVSGPRAADMSRLEFPPTMVVVAGFDSLKDWQMRYYEWLIKSGKEAYLVEYPNMIHAFYIFPELPESGHLISSVKLFIHNQCSKQGKID